VPLKKNPQKYALTIFFIKGTLRGLDLVIEATRSQRLPGGTGARTPPTLTPF